MEAERTAATPSRAMLRDEAIDWLLSQVEDVPRCELRISYAYGQYQAIYESWAAPRKGKRTQNLTDALVSLVEVMTP